MVDSNIQREDLLPSEKAKAYRMKYEALKHQGSREGGRTIEEMGGTAGESGKTVQRYIWLSRLSDGLLDMVDRKRIGFVQGLDDDWHFHKPGQFTGPPSPMPRHHLIAAFSIRAYNPRQTEASGLQKGGR